MSPGGHDCAQSPLKAETGRVEMSLADFEGAVSDALDSIPADLTKLMNNVVVLVEDDVPPGSPALFGLYEGTPLTARGDAWAAGSLPDRITIFRRPTLEYCRTPAEVVEQVRITVIHEIGHHFGIDDHRLHDLGWA